MTIIDIVEAVPEEAEVAAMKESNAEDGGEDSGDEVEEGGLSVGKRFGGRDGRGETPGVGHNSRGPVEESSMWWSLVGFLITGVVVAEAAMSEEAMSEEEVSILSSDGRLLDVVNFVTKKRVEASSEGDEETGDSDVTEAENTKDAAIYRYKELDGKMKNAAADGIPSWCIRHSDHDVVVEDIR